jgi:hypothetical protein
MFPPQGVQSRLDLGQHLVDNPDSIILQPDQNRIRAIKRLLVKIKDPVVNGSNRKANVFRGVSLVLGSHLFPWI